MGARAAPSGEERCWPALAPAPAPEEVEEGAGREEGRRLPWVGAGQVGRGVPGGRWVGAEGREGQEGCWRGEAVGAGRPSGWEAVGCCPTFVAVVVVAAAAGVFVVVAAAAAAVVVAVAVGPPYKYLQLRNEKREIENICTHFFKYKVDHE